MSGQQSLQDVIAALVQRGFAYAGTKGDGWHRLRGPLRVSEKAYDCELRVDGELQRLMQVQLLTQPAGLPSVVPHLLPGGYLCYLTASSVTLDIFDPVGQTLACLERAEYVLGEAVSGRTVADLEEEFNLYWDDEICLTDLSSEALGRFEVRVMGGNQKCLFVVTDDPARSQRRLRSLGQPFATSTASAFRIKSTAVPRPSVEGWPPTTTSRLLSWLGQLDARCKRKAVERLQQASREGAAAGIVLIESPRLTYGFMVDLRTQGSVKLPASTRWRKALQQRPTLLRVVRIDERYVAQRNVPGMKTLAGKSIALVGVGTIGGYLAEMLVRAGAGTGGGCLTLVDPDHLMPNNLGRHCLGYSSLFKSKVLAMAEELDRDMPGANVRPLPVDIRQASLGRVDLLIDATGEEALGHWLVRHVGKRSPMLSCWVEGNGVAVRALLRTGASDGCVRCLYDANRRGRLRVSDRPISAMMAGQGCEGLYVPFPATVSTQAASLAASMTLDWANRVSSPKLQTRILSADYPLATPDQDLPLEPECPACT